MIGVIAKVAEISVRASEIAKEVTSKLAQLDKPLANPETSVMKETGKAGETKIDSLDKPLNGASDEAKMTDSVQNGEAADRNVDGTTVASQQEALSDIDKPLSSEKTEGSDAASDKNIDNLTQQDNPKEGDAASDKNADNLTQQEADEVQRMPQVELKFKCPEGMDPKEFERQLKGQEKGINSQTMLENMQNREAYQQRRDETGNGRDLEGASAQRQAREKAMQERIADNQREGMSYADAKAEAEEYMKSQAALHDPDQIAGGSADHVTGMGDASVNSSIGVQWKREVVKLEEAVNEFAKGKSPEELQNIMMNVKLVMV